jgi:hypothetical protein
MVLARDGLQTAADVSLVVLGVFVPILLFVALGPLLQARRLNGTVRALWGRAVDRAGPLLDQGQNVADNVEFITRALRTDVERLNASVKALTDRLHQASDRMEERIEEFNALMEVVQSEAEQIFIDTASTVRGVRAGARSLGANAAAQAEPAPVGEEAPRPEPEERDHDLEPEPEINRRGTARGT